MMFILRIANDKKIETDSYESISITVAVGERPKFLSEFQEGSGEHNCGYSGSLQKFIAKRLESDSRRLKLNYEEGHDAMLIPHLIRKSGNFDPESQLEEIPLALGQIIKYSSTSTSNIDFKIIALEPL